MTSIVIRVVLTLLAALLAFGIMLKAWGGWSAPPCIGPQVNVTRC